MSTNVLNVFLLLLRTLLGMPRLILKSVNHIANKFDELSVAIYQSKPDFIVLTKT